MLNAPDGPGPKETKNQSNESSYSNPAVVKRNGPISGMNLVLALVREPASGVQSKERRTTFYSIGITSG